VLKSVERDDSDSCADKLFRADKDDDEKAWMWELEKGMHKGEENKPIFFESSSPQAMEENETEVAIVQTAQLERFFSKHPFKASEDDWDKDPPGTHIHVLSKCLVKGDKGDVRRLVGLLLIWERFDTAIYKITGTTLHLGEARLKAAPIEKKSPAVLKHLLSYITEDGWKEPEGGDKSLAKFYNEHESRKEMKGDNKDADGFRRFEVNVCHLLHIKCAHDLPEKEAPAVPKFGALEFRGFDPMVGEALRLVVMLVQRLVQFACSASLGGGDKLHKLAYWDGENDAKSVKDLFEALEIRQDLFKPDVFQNSKFASKAHQKGNKDK
jgi:hypothetical protein